MMSRRKITLFILLYAGIVLAILFSNIYLQDRFGHKAFGIRDALESVALTSTDQVKVITLF